MTEVITLPHFQQSVDGQCLPACGRNEQVWVHDPAKETSPLSVSWDGFLAAWAEFGYRGATVTKG